MSVLVRYSLIFRASLTVFDGYSKAVENEKGETSPIQALENVVLCPFSFFLQGHL
jgi:hypothetical protein